MSIAKRVVKNTIASAFSTVVPRFIQVLLIIYAARKIGDEGLGKYYVVSSLAMIVNLISDFGINGLLARNLSREKEKVSQYFFNVFLLKGILACITYVLLIFFAHILNYSPEIIKGVQIFGIYLIFSAFYYFVGSFFQAFEEMQYSAYFHGIGSILNEIVAFS